jgi:hypothetical protein
VNDIMLPEPVMLDLGKEAKNVDVSLNLQKNKMKRSQNLGKVINAIEKVEKVEKIDRKETPAERIERNWKENSVMRGSIVEDKPRPSENVSTEQSTNKNDNNFTPKNHQSISEFTQKKKPVKPPQSQLQSQVQHTKPQPQVQQISKTLQSKQQNLAQSTGSQYNPRSSGSIMTAGMIVPPPAHHLPPNNPSKINNPDEIRVGKARDQIKKLINRRLPPGSNRESTHIHNSSVECRNKGQESHLARKKTNLDYSMEIPRHPATNNLNISQQHSQSLNRSKDDSRERGFEDLKQRVFRKKGHSQVTSVTSKSRGHDGDMIINTRISTEKDRMNPYIMGAKQMQDWPKAKNQMRPPQQTPKSNATHNSTLSYHPGLIPDDDYRDGLSDRSRAPQQKLIKNFNENLEPYLQQNSTKNRKTLQSNHNKDRYSQPPARNHHNNYGYDANNNSHHYSTSKNHSLRNSVEKNGRKKQGSGQGVKSIIVSDLFVGSHN